MSNAAVNHGLTCENLTAALPDVLRQDPSVAALAQAVAGLLAARTQEIDRLRLYPAISRLPEDLLDILAYDFKVDWWDPEYSLEEKRRTLQTSWKVHKTLGTKAAVETALSAVYAGAKVEEWFEYGGTPYCFRVHVEVGDSEYVQLKHKRVLERIAWYKNLRSHLERIWYEMPLIVFREEHSALLRNFRVLLRAGNWGLIRLNGEYPLDGSWFLGQTLSRLYMVGTQIRTAAKMPHRLRPVRVIASGGIGVVTWERALLNLGAGLCVFHNMGRFVRLDGRHPLDGGWLLDQCARAPRFADFGARAVAAEPEERLWSAASHVRAVHRTWNRAGPRTVAAGVYAFPPVGERVSCTLFRRCASVIREYNAAPSNLRLNMPAYPWALDHRTVSGLPVIRLFCRNAGGFRPESILILTGVREESGCGKLRVRPSAWEVRESAGGVGGVQLTIFRRDRMDGTHLMDGSRTFGGGERESISL